MCECAFIRKLFLLLGLRENYNKYTAKQRAEIGKYASENGTVAAVRKYSKQLEKGINESTIRGFKKAYEVELKFRLSKSANNW